MLNVLRLKKVSTDEESDKKLFLLESKLIKKKIYTLVFKSKFLLNLFIPLQSIIIDLMGYTCVHIALLNRHIDC